MLLFTIHFVKMENLNCFGSFSSFLHLFLEIEWGDKSHIW